MGLDTFKDRLEKEISDLMNKIAGLGTFIGHSKTFLELSEYEASLMKRQLVVMREYYEVLNARLEIIKSKQNNEDNNL